MSAPAGGTDGRSAARAEDGPGEDLVGVALAVGGYGAAYGPANSAGAKSGATGGTGHPLALPRDVGSRDSSCGAKWCLLGPRLGRRAVSPLVGRETPEAGL